MKRVLIITYYWPPSGGSGVQRWLKMAGYLPEFGIEPIILTPENPSFINQDPTLENEVPSDLEVLKLPIWEPYGILEKLKRGKAHQKEVNVGSRQTFSQKILQWVRGNLLIPDPRKFWVRPVTRFLNEYLKTTPVHTIITTGPPHSLHLIGLNIKRKHDIQWIADFRDPWSEWDIMDSFHLSAYAWSKHRKLERKVLTTADKVISVGWEMDKDLRRLGAKNAFVVTNGFDHKDFQQLPPATKDPQKILIRHIGTIDEMRNPRPFLEVLQSMIDEKALGERELCMEFVGNVNPLFKQDVVTHEKWKAFVKFTDYMPHAEILKSYSETNILLLVLAHSHSARLNITGKIFEYIASGVPIMGIGDPEGDAAKVIAESGRGHVISPENLIAVREKLMDYIENDATSQYNLEDSPFTRKALARNIASLI